MIFVSYSRRDATVVMPLVRLLRASGQTVFVDQDDLAYGARWEEELAGAIAKSERFMLFWSRASRLSGPVKREIEVALATGGCRIVPVALDQSPLPAELAPFHGTTDLQFLMQAIRKQRITQRALLIAPLGLAIVGAFWSGSTRLRSVYLPDANSETGIALRLLDLLAVVTTLLMPIAAIVYWRVSTRRRNALYHKACRAIVP